ncbi:MAG TPA: hypothetical protein VI540_04840 [Gaiellaceae bacterium]|nr:hypothetical protein [Gaiellaceae bacterium]
MSATTDIDTAIDRLDEALRRAGLQPLAPARDTSALDEIAEAIAPWELPGDLRRFWGRVAVEPDAFPVSGWCMGSLDPPERALSTHRLNFDPDVYMPFGPPFLFPIARHAETQWSAELASEWCEGGTVFSCPVDIEIEYPSFADLIDVYAELLEEGEFERGYGGRATLSLEGERRKQEERFRAAWPHPLYCDMRTIAKDSAEWPAHWLALAGLDLRDREPLGATHTIAELVAVSKRGPITGRVIATVTRVMGFGGDLLVLVEDGTGKLDLWIPAGTSSWGWGRERRAEFEVEVQRPIPPPPDLDRGYSDISRHALAGRVEEAQAAAETYFGRLEQYRPTAVATAVRPLDRPS